MYTINFEDFIEETWDYVSEDVVSDDLWEMNEAFIRGITHDMYKHYKDSLMKMPSGAIIETVTPKICGLILESFFRNLQDCDIKRINK